MNQPLIKRLVSALVAPAIAVAVAVVVSSITLLLSGNSPIEALRAMANYFFTTDSIVATLNRVGPLYVVSLAVAIGFKMNLFNIGVDGQYRLAALFSAAIGAELHLPRVLHIVAVMVIAMVVGAAWAAIPGALKVTRNVNEVVSTIMLNFVATGLTAYLLVTYFRNKKVENVSETKAIPRSGRLPTLNGVVENFGFHFPRLTQLNGFLPIAIVVGILFYLLVWRTRFGFDLRMTGANKAAARASGVNPSAMIMKTILISGALAGLAASGFVLTDFPKYSDAFPLGLAFTGIGVALLGRNHPAGIAVAALVWQGIDTASRGLLEVQIPPEITIIMLGTLLMSSVISFEVVRRRRLDATIKEAGVAATPTAPVVGAPS
ncbi:MAG TPA: ABC transporter permease [Ilumatobacteraceae bacterium]|nr:ABC transporter permease [Ilumatobacteraceae bacterium]